MVQSQPEIGQICPLPSPTSLHPRNVPASVGGLGRLQRMPNEQRAARDLAAVLQRISQRQTLSAVEALRWHSIAAPMASLLKLSKPRVVPLVQRCKQTARDLKQQMELCSEAWHAVAKASERASGTRCSASLSRASPSSSSSAGPNAGGLSNTAPQRLALRRFMPRTTGESIQGQCNNVSLAPTATEAQEATMVWRPPGSEDDVLWREFKVLVAGLGEEIPSWGDRLSRAAQQIEASYVACRAECESLKAKSELSTITQPAAEEERPTETMDQCPARRCSNNGVPPIPGVRIALLRDRGMPPDSSNMDVAHAGATTVAIGEASVLGVTGSNERSSWQGSGLSLQADQLTPSTPSSNSQASLHDDDDDEEEEEEDGNKAHVRKIWSLVESPSMQIAPSAKRSESGGPDAAAGAGGAWHPGRANTAPNVAAHYGLTSSGGVASGAPGIAWPTPTLYTPRAAAAAAVSPVGPSQRHPAVPSISAEARGERQEMLHDGLARSTTSLLQWQCLGTPRQRPAARQNAGSATANGTPLGTGGRGPCLNNVGSARNGTSGNSLSGGTSGPNVGPSSGSSRGPLRSPPGHIARQLGPQRMASGSLLQQPSLQLGPVPHAVRGAALRVPSASASPMRGHAHLRASPPSAGALGQGRFANRPRQNAPTTSAVGNAGGLCGPSTTSSGSRGAGGNSSSGNAVSPQPSASRVQPISSLGDQSDPWSQGVGPTVASSERGSVSATGSTPTAPTGCASLVARSVPPLGPTGATNAVGLHSGSQGYNAVQLWTPRAKRTPSQTQASAASRDVSLEPGQQVGRSPSASLSHSPRSYAGVGVRVSGTPGLVPQLSTWRC